MFNDEFTAVTKAAQDKLEFLKSNPLGYFVASMLAGAYIGFGVLVFSTVGGLLSGDPYARIVMGASFGIALSLVVMAGAELFTGNNFVFSLGLFGKKLKLGDIIKILIVCYIGNWIGAILLAAVFRGTGLTNGAAGEFIASLSAAKMSVPAVELFLRGLLCNTLVCLAVWCTFRCKSESARLMMIFWCLLAFNVSSFEHSIANMTLLTVSLLAPFGAAVSLGGYFYNILLVTLGNMTGGILCMALPYYLIAGKHT